MTGPKARGGRPIVEITGGPERSGPLSLLSMVRPLRSTFENWYLVGPMALLALPSRLPPRKGIPMLFKRVIDIRLRNGYRARCRIEESRPFVEIFALGEYDIPGFGWESLHSVLDIGASVGAAALWFAQRAPLAHIVAVEPSAAAGQQLRQNITMNQLEERVEVVSAAVGAESGVGFLRTAGGPAVSGTIVASAEESDERVSVISLGDLLQRTHREGFDVLKMDCEGSEFDIVRSAKPSLLRRFGTIVGEYHGGEGRRVEELTELLLAAGFRCEVRGNERLGTFVARRED